MSNPDDETVFFYTYKIFDYILTKRIYIFIILMSVIKKMG